SIAAGVLLSPARRAFRTPWPWRAAGVALLVFLPNLVWQIRHDFATLEDLRHVSQMGKNVVLGPAAFVAQQIVLVHPILLPLWLGGLLFLFRARQGRYRAPGWTYVVFLVVLFALKAK